MVVSPEVPEVTVAGGGDRGIRILLRDAIGSDRVGKGGRLIGEVSTGVTKGMGSERRWAPKGGGGGPGAVSTALGSHGRRVPGRPGVGGR